MRLLVVEDEEDLAGALRVGLARAGYAVDLAADAAQAYDLLLVNAYDLMLLDVNLPDVDGFAMCRAIRSGEVEVAGGQNTNRRVARRTGGGVLPTGDGQHLRAVAAVRRSDRRHPTTGRRTAVTRAAARRASG